MSAEPNLIDNANRSKEEDASVALAELGRELTWKSKSFIGSMYMGDLDDQLCFPYPEQAPADKAEGDELIAKVDAWCAENLDGELIDSTEVIPASVLRGLHGFGLFAIKIPKKYGGLGMSQTNYMRLLSTVARYCGATAATLSAHQSIGVPQPLKLFGTEEQKQKFLPRIAAGEITAFGLTEPNAGSDPANMVTEAKLSEDGKHWILNGYKLWCTNGVIADLFVVMAKTGEIKKHGRTINSISAFVVEGTAEGVEIAHRCHFMGIKAIENGIIRFKDVKIPAEDLIWGEGKGLRLALTTLNDGRLGIPAIAAAGMKDVADWSAQWGKSRNQWGKTVGQHEAGAEKLAKIAAGAYAMDAIAMFGAALSDAGDVDIRMEAAAAKLFNTELCWELMDTALQFRGGRGFETATSLEGRGEQAFPIERALRDSRINRIVEGTSDIMHLFLAREALDPHLSRAGILFNKRASTSDKIKAIVDAAGFYAIWYPKLWIGGLFKDYPGFRGVWGKHIKWVDGKTRKVARTLFHQMALKGPKLEMHQNTLARIVDIGIELAVMSLVASRAQTSENNGDKSNSDIAAYYLDWGKLRVEALFHDLKHNVDDQSRVLAKKLMDQAELLPDEEDLDSLPSLPREFGSDLLTGKQKKRLANGGKSPRK